MGVETRLRPVRVKPRDHRRTAALGFGRRGRQADVSGPRLLSRSPHRPRRARIRNDEVPDDVRGRVGAPGSARIRERSLGAAVQDQRRPTCDSGWSVPAPLLARRAPAGPERPLGRDVARRPAAATDPRLRAVATMAPEALSRAAGDDGPVAGVGPDRPQLRRPRAARLLLHRELVDLARHLDPRQDVAGGARPSRRVLRGPIRAVRRGRTFCGGICRMAGVGLIRSLLLVVAIALSAAACVTAARQLETLASRGVLLKVPDGWSRVTRAVDGNVVDPRTVLVAGTQGVRRRPSRCQVAAYRIPPTGAVVVVIAWRTETSGGGVPPRLRKPLRALKLKRSSFECFKGRGGAAQLA